MMVHFVHLVVTLSQISVCVKHKPKIKPEATPNAKLFAIHVEMILFSLPSPQL